MINRLRQIPPVGWVALAACAGVAFLAWHQFANDDTDEDWTSAKERQPDPVLQFPMSPAAHGTGSPMSCNTGFRSRSYAPSLVDAHFSIIGEF